MKSNRRLKKKWERKQTLSSADNLQGINSFNTIQASLTCSSVSSKTNSESISSKTCLSESIMFTDSYNNFHTIKLCDFLVEDIDSNAIRCTICHMELTHAGKQTVYKHFKSKDHIKKWEILTSQSTSKQSEDEQIVINNPVCSAVDSLLCATLRLGSDQDFCNCLVEFVRKNSWKSAFIMTCVGSVKSATLRMAQDGLKPNNELQIVPYKKHFEIVSLVGTICPSGSYHLHISLSDCHGNLTGGHVVDNVIIHTTAEVVLGTLPKVLFTRQPDLKSGWKELHMEKII